MQASYHPALPTPQGAKQSLMVDIAGHTLCAEDREILVHPLVGSLILFTRNYDSPTQLRALCDSIHALNPNIKIAVDHEGGRVQRFRKGFSEIPPMRTLGAMYKNDKNAALICAEALAYLMADELIKVGVDFSFTPVLDLDYGSSTVIGNRAFSSDVDEVIALSTAFNKGLHRSGMPSIGKHFPGHGFVAADSHHELPIDNRPLCDIKNADLKPFAQHARVCLDAVMMAHVVYPQIDSAPAGFSNTWIQTILRQHLAFTGLIFSDDLSMQGARAAEGGESIVSRCLLSLKAGCEVLIICNDRPSVLEVLQHGLPT